MPTSTARSLATNTAATHSAATSPFDFLAAQGHERLVIFHDPATDLRGAIAIHSTVRGPARAARACAPTRAWRRACWTPCGWPKR